MSLADWEERLDEHFARLSRDRLEAPVFALEHGLAPAEFLALASELRAHIERSAPEPDHQVVWAVYAAEVGYDYEGLEYWQTFENKTPGWNSNGKRTWIRDAFVAFQKRYSGATPSGPWAEQFSIIAWPITHAILPRDLQQQLAEILYDLRHAFSAELFEEPRRLGDFIASQSSGKTTRFQKLVQAPALVGQIAATLLLGGTDGFMTRIHPMTLERIGRDVDRERRGREWLRDARRAAEARASIRGLAFGKPTTPRPQRREEARAEIERLGIEPRLVLRPVGGSCWEVSLEVPDLSHLLLRFPQVREVLAESRCTVAGAAGRPLARGRFLHGPQKVTLRRWPRPDEVLLGFERSDPQLEYLLRAECMLRPGSSWLFKVASDGLAYELRGTRVRADSKYLLVSIDPLPQSPLASPAELACEGVYAVVLDLPSALTPVWEQELKHLQVSLAKSIEVWPAGLAAVAWDGESHGEWLASETPTIAIRSDHPIDELIIASAEGASLTLRLTDSPPGEAVFVELSSLPVGLHRFSVAARTGSGASSEVIGELDVVMRVREGRHYSPGAATHGLVEVELDPVAPSLEQLWEGTADVLVRGPIGRLTKCRVRMFARADEAPLLEKTLPPLSLPISTDDWSQHFDKHVKKQKDASRVYDDVHLCEVEFAADELGAFTLRCEREFTPLRWSLRRDSEAFVVRLHDNAGSGDPVIVHFPFERPTVATTVPAGAEQRAPRGGALYVATLGTFHAAVVVPPVVTGLADLGCEPQIDLAQRSPESLDKLLRCAELWAHARLPGDPIAPIFRLKVLHALTESTSGLIAGQNWMGVERTHAPEQLARCIGKTQREKAFGVRLQDERQSLAGLATAARIRKFAALAEQFEIVDGHQETEAVLLGSASGVPVLCRPRPAGPEHPTWLAEFALRVASSPSTLRGWAGEHFDAGIKKILESAALVRAARFLVLAVAHHREPRAASGELYAGWRWLA